VGGWVVIAAGTLAFVVWFVEWYRHRKPGGFLRKKILPFLLLPLFSLSSCSTKPEPFQPGTDNCYFCKMGITDTRFGAELITKKGKIYKFDDLHCLILFLKNGGEETGNISKTLTVLFDQPNEFLETDQAFFVKDLALRSPMGSNTAGFSSLSIAEKMKAGKSGAVILRWKELLEQLK
jgi:copper chaperone NosL